MRIPRNESGAQPFDVIAVNDKFVRCFDCKVLTSRKSGRFPLDRIEDNQWLAFEAFEQKTKKESACGIAVFYEGNIYVVGHYFLKRAVNAGVRSIDLRVFKPFLSAQEIEEILGYKLQ